MDKNRWMKENMYFDWLFVRIVPTPSLQFLNSGIQPFPLNWEPFTPVTICSTLFQFCSFYKTSYKIIKTFFLVVFVCQAFFFFGSAVFLLFFLFFSLSIILPSLSYPPPPLPQHSAPQNLLPFVRFVQITILDDSLLIDRWRMQTSRKKKEKNF